MKRKFKNLLRVTLILCITLIAVNCAKEELSDQQKTNAAIDKAQKWFKDYQTNGDNLGMFQNSNYQWTNAQVKKAKDGTEFIVVPIAATKVNPNEIWEQKLYIYKIAQNNYTALLYEFYPENTTNANLGNFSGHIIAWDLKTGFVKAAKFVNDKRIENGVVEILSNENLNLTNRTNLDPDIETTGGGIALREVVVQNNYKDTFIFYIPSGSNSSGGNYSNYTESHGGGSNGSSNTNTPKNQDPKNPCDQIKDLLNYKPNDPSSMKANINWLKTKVNATVNSKECGVEIKKLMNPDETYRYEFNQVLSADQFSVPLTTGFSYVGGLHSHPADGYAMFSYQDVRFLLEAYDGASDSRKGEVFNSVVCKDNAGNTNVYMIKIDNVDALRTQVNAVWNDPNYTKFTAEKDRINAIHKDQAKLYYQSKGQLEKSFLVQFASFGITMYKADAGLNNFNKLNLNNSTLTTIPCT